MKVRRRLLQELNNFRYAIESNVATIKPSVNSEIPFVCQFALPENAELSLRKLLDPVNDQDWQKTGALSPKRYAEWAFTMCGMASAAMGLNHLKNTNVLPAQLAEDAMQSEVYVDEQGIISGMRYHEFVPWIKKYGVEAQIYSRLSIKGIQLTLSNGGLVMVSVNPNIRGYDTAPLNQKGGHLVLVTGYDTQKKTIAINNPSGFVSTNTQVNHQLSYGEFKKYYAGRGILLSAIT